MRANSKKPTGGFRVVHALRPVLGNDLAASSLAVAETPLTIDQLLAQGLETSRTNRAQKDDDNDLQCVAVGAVRCIIHGVLFR